MWVVALFVLMGFQEYTYKKTEDPLRSKSIQFEDEYMEASSPSQFTSLLSTRAVFFLLIPLSLLYYTVLLMGVVLGSG